ncbi:intimin/invasin [Salmonella enterica subsp. enterica serovar Typhi]|nr:Ig-like domain-containing protein [Salmonella enterica]CFX37929.1 intimin/invasin [Salmonella enterica subsp. enterica serovar Typhi]CFX51028.1 intimin/invasin [Salmonella enterica subsp. enterica serovar Typhi]CGI21133.1 intimin/invasin [Salmonella enterica subsp. enterica serovar Typhi]CGI32683.1 intimin/invasin [Salmonella enterica subsp. enterica serovar Typhi]CHM36504.1 intimin/invasin [Salmonella enterica subsp. enterica serovar Typhi]
MKIRKYRKQTLITLQLPPDVYGAELTTVTLTPQVNARYGLSRIELDDAELRQAGGKIISNTGNQIILQLPAWSSDRQSVTLSGRARDTRGNLSDIARTRILVSPAVQQQLAVSTDKTTVTADGTDSVRYTLTVTGSDGKPVSGQAVRWEHNGGTLNGENTTNADGVATATLTSQTAGIIRVAATTRNQTAKAADVTFVAAMQGELLADRTQALADGQEAVSYTLTLKTTDGKPFSGKNVTFTTTAGQLSRTQGTTDQNGQLSVQLTSTRAGQAVVNASVDGTTISAAPVMFETRPDTAIVVNKTSAVADGQDSIILTAVIRDAAGIPVAGQAVTWHTDNGQFTQQDAVTNAAGAASATLTSTQAGNAQVSLSLNGTTTTVSAPRVSFTQQLYLTLQAGRTTAVADGNDVITYTLNVRDVAGQPVKDKAVQWSTDLGTLSPLQGTTSAQGEATVTLTSTQAGQAVVNATVDGKQISAQSVTFTRTVRGVITVEKERVYPGSKQTVTLTLTDAAGNPVSGERVDWHADSGNLWQTQGTTDAQGRTTTTWESTTPGTATITADAYGQQYTAPVITVMPALTVSSVTGIDATGADGKNFGRRVPASTWPGAKFRIDTENAAGTVTWTASSPAVSINGNIMTVKSNPAGVTLTGTDADGQTVTLNMGSNWFAQSATKWEWLNGDYDGTAIYSCRQLGAQVASSGALQGVISEWGELETYEGWTNLKNDWLYSSTTVISGNGVKSTIAYLFPGGKEGLLTGIRGYYACR